MKRSLLNTVVLLLVTLLLLPASPVIAASSLPEGLKNAAKEYLSGLQVVEYRTRDSTLEDPAGIIPMAKFDRETHGCHEAPGQAYRVYKQHIGFKRNSDGTYTGRVSFHVFYRQAATMAEVFAQPWEEGSDGKLEITLEQIEGVWTATNSREVIQ